MEIQRKVREDKFRLGLLKPDTFAEDGLLSQQARVYIMLVMHNRCHNYAAAQLKRIDENGRLSVPSKFEKTKPLAMAEDWACVPYDKRDAKYKPVVNNYVEAWDTWCKQSQKLLSEGNKANEKAEATRRRYLEEIGIQKKIDALKKAYEAAWIKLDELWVLLVPT